MCQFLFIRVILCSCSYPFLFSFCILHICKATSLLASCSVSPSILDHILCISWCSSGQCVSYCFFLSLSVIYFLNKSSLTFQFSRCVVILLFFLSHTLVHSIPLFVVLSILMFKNCFCLSVFGTKWPIWINFNPFEDQIRAKKKMQYAFWFFNISVFWTLTGRNHSLDAKIIFFDTIFFACWFYYIFGNEITDVASFHFNFKFLIKQTQVAMTR